MTRVLFILGFIVAGPVAAAEPRVPVVTRVVLARVEGSEVSPGLEAMKAALARKVDYGTLRLLSEQKLTLGAEALEVKLPNGLRATLLVESLKEQVATVRIRLPPSDSSYQLGKKGSLFLQGGAWQDGVLWFVVSPGL